MCVWGFDPKASNIVGVVLGVSLILAATPSIVEACSPEPEPNLEPDAQPRPNLDPTPDDDGMRGAPEPEDEGGCQITVHGQSPAIPGWPLLFAVFLVIRRS